MKPDHAPYLPNQTPCNFQLLSKLKTTLKNHRFLDNVNIIEHAVTILISILDEEFQQRFE
jgi:hypothetical protein